MEILADIFQNLTIATAIKMFLVGLVIGFTTGMTGIGGGVMTLPALIHIIGLMPVTAVGTGLAYSMVSKIAGSLFHYRQRTINRSHLFSFLIGGVPGVLVASWTIHYLVRYFDREAINEVLQLMIAILLLVTAVIFVLEFPYLKEKRRRLFSFPRRPQKIKLNLRFQGILISFLIGLFIGATSIGGGVLIIPALIIVFKAPASEAVGTSIAISVVIAVIGSLIYLSGGLVDVTSTVFLCLGSIPGVYFGSKMTKKIPETFLKAAVLLLIILSGISLFFKNASLS